MGLKPPISGSINEAFLGIDYANNTGYAVVSLYEYNELVAAKVRAGLNPNSYDYLNKENWELKRKLSKAESQLSLYIKGEQLSTKRWFHIF